MEREKVSTCAELAHGDVVQTHRRGVFLFTGCVAEVHASQELFWAYDSVGHRHLIDLESHDVYLLYPPYL